MGKWDDLLKFLISASPQHFVSWLLKGAIYVSERSVELKSRTINADILYNITLNGVAMILHIEFQRRSDPMMGKRAWEYNAMTTITSGLPVLSVVLYLKPGLVVEPPYRVELPNGELVHLFVFHNMEIWKVPTKTLREEGLVGLLPLLPYTTEGAQREIVEEVAEKVEAAGRRDLFPAVAMIASDVLGKEGDFEWILRRFNVHSDWFEDTQLYQYILQRGEEQGIEKGVAQGIEQGREQGKILSLYEAAIEIAQERFPSIIAITKNQIETIQDANVLRHLIVKMSVASTEQEALQALVAATNEEQKH